MEYRGVAIDLSVVAAALGCDVAEIVKVRIDEARRPGVDDRLAVIVRDAPESAVGPKYVVPIIDVLGAQEPEEEESEEPEELGEAGFDVTDGALALAREEGVSLAEVVGSGVDGRILVSDVRAVIAQRAQDAAQEAEEENGD